jgi:hypothetical protein
MSEHIKRSPVAWEPLAAAMCFVSAVIALAIGFVFTTRWLLDDHLHPLLHGVGLVLLVLGIPIMILGGHFMDLRDKKRKQQSHYADLKNNNGNANHALIGLITLLAIFCIHSGNVNAQIPETSPEEQPAEQSGPKGQYGGFVDLAYPLDFNHPENHLFRSRGTVFRTDSVWLNMAGAHARFDSPTSR